MKAELSHNLFLTEYPDAFGLEIIEKLTLPNPAYLDAQKMRRWTGNLSPVLEYYHEVAGGLSIPRGCLDLIRHLAAKHGHKIIITDRRRTMPEVDFTFTGKLRDFQKTAVSAVTGSDEGVLCAPTGSGKTVVALDIISRRKQPTLILVHTRELLNQWIERIETFLNLPAYEIGVIGGGRKVIGEKITVGIINSVYPIAEPILRHHFGQVIVDECHRAPARTFTDALAAFDARYIMGLSATPYRRDGLSSVIYWHCGMMVHKIQQADLQTSGDIVPADVMIRYTRFRSFADPAGEYAKMLSELTQDQDRNDQICSDVIREARNGGGVCLILTDRKEHAETLSTIIISCGVHAEQLTGDLAAKDRQLIVEKLNTGSVKVIVATGQLIGEGFDCRGLCSLFMATPISYVGRLIQYLGRVLRPAPGKTRAKVFDYVDQCGVLQAQAKKRQDVYENNKWRILQ